MFPDEQRDPRHLEDLKVNRVASDPEAFYRELKALKGKGYERKIAHLLEERKDLKRRISTAHDALGVERTKNERISKENTQLKTKLDQLRKSKTMRLGKAVAAPLKSANRAVKDPVGFSRDAGLNAKQMSARINKKVRRQVASLKPREQDAQMRNSLVRSRNENTTASRSRGDAPQHVDLEVSLKQFWYVHGDITNAAELVRNNEAFFEDSSESLKSLSQRVLGAARLVENRIDLPKRVDDCAYVAEPQRLMYCVNQSPIFNSNGYSTRTRGVVEGLSQAGWDTVVVARSGYPWDSKVDSAKPGQSRNQRLVNGVTYVHTPGGNLNRDPLDVYFQVAADAFVREARLNRPSLIQSASNFRTALPALMAARRVGVPFVYEVRGLWELTEASAKPGFEDTERFALMRDLETLVAKEADQVLAITKQVAEELVERGVPRERISVAPNAVDTHRFLPIPEDEHYKARKEIPSKGPVIGFAGSIVGYEGLDLLIQASEKLGKAGVDHSVVIAGSGSAEKELRELAKSCPNAKVIFLGRLPQAEIPRLMSTFDVVACPRHSTLVTELVSPLKPLESFSAGIATLLSDVAPNIDLAGSAECPRAALFKAGDVESLAAELRKLIEEPELRSVLGRRARLWTVESRSWRSVADHMISAYHESEQRHNALAVSAVKTADLNVGVIGDEFTRTTLRDSFNVTLLSRTKWETQLQRGSIDLVVVESAWEGNDGDWHRGVGHYSDEESSALRGLLRMAKERGIPTVFWNKEDPVHFSRFAPNAAMFDHVFTTDANMIPRYASLPGNQIKTVASLPFYAQPSIHNPLPGAREFDHSFAYAGTYYGERYADRSKGLDQLLQAAQNHGLAIYDRQANNPDSPYKFPAKYSASIRGALPYQEVIDSYATHIAQLNVSSVTNSPTMFSRRVVEIPACGGIVVSSPGRGIAETLGSNVPASSAVEDLDAWMLEWAMNPKGRLEEIWRQFRTVYRSHTTLTAMAILCRTAGIPVSGMQLPTYVVELPQVDQNVLSSVLNQSVPPVAVVGDFSDEQRQQFCDAGIAPFESYDGDAWFRARVTVPIARTHFEDLLLCTLFGEWDAISPLPATEFVNSNGIVQALETSSVAEGGLTRRGAEFSQGIGVYLPDFSAEDGDVSTELSPEFLQPESTIVVAGHDLKFAGAIIDELENRGYNVLIDKWDSHTQHDEEKSAELLAQADAVFCEWGLGNAVWYSNHVEPDQKLIVRVHSQELFRPYLKQIDTTSVDRFIFVGELIRSAAIISHGVPGDKALVVPNPVDTRALDRPKEVGAEFAVGFVGMVPRSKRLDRALDVLEELQKVDSRFHLRIKGKTPEDYPWMANRPEEMKFYDAQFDRIERLNRANPGSVTFDGFGADMADWYAKVGYVISTSDFESFHLTLADGAASKATPGALSWPGSDLIYPLDWLAATEELAELLVQRRHSASQDQSFVEEHFEAGKILDQVVSLIATK